MMSGALAVIHGAFGRAALYKMNKPMVTHAHREGHLIFHVGGADADVAVGDSVVRLKPGSAVAISPWEPHSFTPLNGENTMCMTLYIKPMWFLETSRSAECALAFGLPYIDVTPAIELSVKRLTSLLMELDSPSRFDGYLFETTAMCFEQSWHGDGPSADQLGVGRFSDYRVRRSLRLMQERFAEDIEMNWLAKEAGLSRPHFFKLFRKQMGITPNLYLNTLRTEQAIDDLMTSEKSVTDISFDLGFSSQASFTRFFSSNVGIPPSDYRRAAHIS